MKKLFGVLLIYMLFAAALLPKTDASAAVPQQGEILDAGELKVMVWHRSEGNREVFVYDCGDMDCTEYIIPEYVEASGYEWKIVGILDYAFGNCVTPDTIVLNSHLNFYYMSPTAFVNGKKQEIRVNPSDGNWDTLYPILEYMGPAPRFKYENIPSDSYGNYSLKQNSEDVLYVKVPKGKYTLKSERDPEAGREIRVYRNTTLYLKGVTFKRNPTEKALESTMLSLGNTGVKDSEGNYPYGGYTGGSNIKILYGTFDNGTLANAGNICRMSHLKDVTVQGTVFKYLPKKKLDGKSNPHCIEFAGCKNVLIKSCKFYNNKNCKFDNEAVQLESCSKDESASKHTGIAGPLDDTQSSDITIDKCYFEGFNYGCGSNHLGKNDLYKNIKITNNTFVGCQKYCICLFNYENVTIKGNTAKNCANLYVDLNKSVKPSKKVSVKKNKTE